VVITDRNRIVVEIVPPRRDANKFFERGVREGWLTLPADPAPAPPSGGAFDELMQELERDRDDR